MPPTRCSRRRPGRGSTPRSARSSSSGRTDAARAPWRSSPSTTRAPLSFAAEAHLPAAELAELRARAFQYGVAAGDAAAALYSNREALNHYEAAAALVDDDERAAQSLAEKRGDVAFRLGQVDAAIALWEACLEFYSERGESARAAELHRKIGAGLAHRGERQSAVAHLQRGINLIKDSEPSLTLVRLYEEAAWLYMQVGDNMLAIYASEKALRLAEGLGRGARGEPRPRDLRARVRPHRRQCQGPREPRARRRAGARIRRRRDRARGARTRPQPRARRGRLRGGRRALRRSAGAGPADRRHPGADRTAGGPRPARLLPRRLGRGRTGDRRGSGAGRTRGARRQAVPGEHPSRPAALARRRLGDIGAAVLDGPRAGRARRLVGGRVQRPDRPREHAARPRASSPLPRRRSAMRWRCASEPAWSLSRFRCTPR